MLARLNELEAQALAELAHVSATDALEQWRIAYVGTNGRLKTAMNDLKSVPKESKPAVGKRLNEVKAALDAAFAEKQGSFAAQTHSGPQVDLTEPGSPVGLGRRHVLSRTIDEIIDVFARMGFAVASGPELEDEWHNFNALNIPAGHPARDPRDNFYLAGTWAERLLLRTQTSTVQIRAMESQEPPLKVVATGRVYRPDAHDATHFSMFHQIEGLCIDKNVSMVDLKSALLQFARAYFGADAEVRLRPSFFPFTEPSAEFDMKMRIRGQLQWVELGGCGMVDPNVLHAVGVNPEVWTGYAFGLGIERIAMRRYGIADIRWLFENDARFLRQF
ncbi:MAG: phenylalanine--tRNA ligase subunit alpha [Phycisphaerae bacterium]|nr:phenylalanine--tRNA ligase subunit alpha [Phycisphaerae bacterium]